RLTTTIPAPRILTVLREKKGSLFLWTVLNGFNCAVVLNAVGTMWVLSAAEKSCAAANVLKSFGFHTFMILFDFFMLYKSWAVTEFNAFYGGISALLTLYRFVWAVIDMCWSQGQWNQNNCWVFVNPTSNLQYTLADVLTDSVATIGAVMMFVKNHGNIQMLEGQSLWFLIARENVLRTTIILSMDLYYLYTIFVPLGVSEWMILSAAQNLVYSALMNIELVWKDVRDSQSSQNSRLKRFSSATQYSGDLNTVIPKSKSETRLSVLQTITINTSQTL
ncbi:hypothetical protein BCR33DRAFT_715143, partial [Rhizoclosmatium globosum]